jgi:hypothetical protein
MREISGLGGDLLASQEGLCSMELLTKSGYSRQIFIKVPSIKFQGNPLSEGQAERRTGGKGRTRRGE